MDVSYLINPLNDAQRAAVTAPLEPTLVLAGAGSGKTRVLTHRVAWLIQVEGVSPHGVLAVTFTNKAAGEMRGRIESLLDRSAASLWIGTFHGLAHRFLRMHWREAKLPQSFQILDAEDQLRLMRKVLKAMELDETRWVPKEVTGFINAQKDEGHRREESQGQRRSDAPPAHSDLSDLSGHLRARRRRRLRGAAAAQLRAAARQRRHCSSTTGSASGTCWSMSSRTPTASSTAGCGCSPARTGAAVRGRR